MSQSLERLTADVAVVMWKSGCDQNRFPAFDNQVWPPGEVYENLSLEEIRAFKPWMSMPAGAFTWLHLSNYHHRLVAWWELAALQRRSLK